MSTRMTVACNPPVYCIVWCLASDEVVLGLRIICGCQTASQFDGWVKQSESRRCLYFSRCFAAQLVPPPKCRRLVGPHRCWISNCSLMLLWPSNNGNCLASGAQDSDGRRRCCTNTSQGLVARCARPLHEVVPYIHCFPQQALTPWN